MSFLDIVVGWERVVSIATRYGHASRSALEPIQSAVQRGSGPFPGARRPGLWSPISIQRPGWRKWRVIPRFPSGPSWPVLGWNLPVPYFTWQRFWEEKCKPCPFYIIAKLIPLFSSRWFFLVPEEITASIFRVRNKFSPP